MPKKQSACVRRQESVAKKMRKAKRTMPAAIKTKVCTKTGLPDVAAENAAISGTLDRVGMEGIELPVRVPCRRQNGRQQPPRILSPAKASVFVNLTSTEARGIHMSRLYMETLRGLAMLPLHFRRVNHLLHALLRTHKDAGLSDEAELSVDFPLVLSQQSLTSNLSGYRTYPCQMSGRLTASGFEARLQVRVTYSSTCPASAALSREANAEKFEAFHVGAPITVGGVAVWLRQESSTAATPHSQRSVATVDLVVADLQLTAAEVVGLVEGALGTAVQTAVKRSDEQAFAVLNASNLMFCEDAGRRLKALLHTDPRISDFRIRIEHMESLHPHNAVCVVVKGVAGGLQPQ